MLTLSTSLDSKVADDDTDDVIDTSLAHLYDHNGGGNEITTGVNKTGLADGIGTFELKDIRDNKTYLTRRLADGNCWMVQNLDLDLANFAGKNLSTVNLSETPNAVLTAKNTDLNTANKTYWDPGESMYNLAKTIDSTVTREQSSYFSVASLDRIGTSQAAQFQSDGQRGNDWHWGSKLNESGEKIYDSNDTSVENPLVYTRNRTDSRTDIGTESRVPRNRSKLPGTATNTIFAWTDQTYAISVMIGNNTAGGFQSGTLRYIESNSRAEMPRSYDNGDSYVTIAANVDGMTEGQPVSSGNGTQHLGDLYNWYAATAESGTWNLAVGNVVDSICPYGWQLPKNGGTKSWYYLINATYGLNSDRTGSRSLRSFPLSVNASGIYYSIYGGIGARGMGGNYWSSDTYSHTSSYMLGYGNTSIYPSGGASNPDGLTIRCVAHGNEIQSDESQAAVATTCSAGKICYDGNGGTGSMADQSASAGSSVVLTAPTYTRLGYSFAGWSTHDNGFGTVYGPNETITVPSQATLGSGNGYQLYAKWLPSTGTMQDFTTAQCNALGEHQSIALTDNRDGNTYTVTKLKDGNCWMTTNLALNLADFAGDNPKSGYLTTENTDIGNDVDGSGNPTRTDLIDITSTNGGNGSLYRWDPAKSMKLAAQNIITADHQKAAADQKYADITTITDDNYFSIVSAERLGVVQTHQFQSSHYKMPDGTYVDQQGPEWYWNSKCSAEGNCDQSAESSDNVLTAMPRSYYQGNNAFGTLYDWYSATAESGKRSTPVSTNASDSLCPKGWTLPGIRTTTNTITWTELLSVSYNGITSEQIRQRPISFVFSGFYSSGSGTVARQETDLHFMGWTSSKSASDQTLVNSVVTSASSVYIGTTYGLKLGLSVRCALK